MKLVITGGTGFIGSRLALQCLAQGHQAKVIGLVNNPWEQANRDELEAAGVDVVLGSVVDRKQVFEHLRGADVVFHLAAAQHEANVTDRYFWDVNVKGTQNVLEACVEGGVRRLVHGSTIGVYGFAQTGPLDESSPLVPDNIYGRTKLEAERLVRSFAGTLPLVILRISETYGPGDQRLLRLFRAIKKNAFLMFGKGDNFHHLIHVDDLVSGLLLAASSPQGTGQTFVMAGKHPITTKEMVGTIAAEVGTKAPTVRIPLGPAVMLSAVIGKSLGAVGIQPPIHPRRMDFFRKSFVFSTHAARDVLGFAPGVGFFDGIRITAGWYREKGYL